MLMVLILSILVLVAASPAPNPNVNVDVDVNLGQGSANNQMDHDAGQADGGIKCGIENTREKGSNRIVNGAEVDIPRQYSWQVGLYQYASNIAILKQVCGGSIINDKFILTAAHCVKEPPPSCEVVYHYIFVGIGSNEKSDTSIFIQVTDVFTNNYNCLNNDNDIALLELKVSISKLLISGYIHPVCLPKDNKNDYAGEYAIVTGWGGTIGYDAPPSTRPPGQIFPNDLKEATVPVINNTECQKSYASHPKPLLVTPNMICTSNGKGFAAGANNSCQGDSGGPVTYKETIQHVQIGIVSWAYGCAAEGYPGVYARVTSYLTWIELIAGKIYQIQ